MNNIKINIHPSFIILLLVGLFSGHIEKILYFILVIISHELAHLIAAKIFKVRYYAIHLTIIGCMIDLSDYSDIAVWKQFIINIVGILMNTILLILFNFTNNNLLVEYNKLMIIFNLLPISPLDGYKLIYNLLSLIFDDEYIIDCLYYLSLIILTILSITIYIIKLYGYFLIIIFLFLNTIKTKKEIKKYKLKHYLLFKKSNSLYNSN